MDKCNFFAMFGIYFGNSYHGCDPVLQLAYNNWEFYEKSNFSEESLEFIKKTLNIVKKYRLVYGQAMRPIRY